MSSRCQNTHRLERDVIDGENMKAGLAIHHAVVQVASFVMEVHRLEEVVIGLQGEHIELRVLARVLIDDEVTPLRVNALLMGMIFLLVNLQRKL